MDALNEIRTKIASLPISFQEKGPVSFSMNGVSTDTLLFTFDGSEFVYVPGKRGVTLGWDPDLCPLGEQVTATLRDYYEEGEEYRAAAREDIAAYYKDKIAKAEAAGDQAEVEKLREDMQSDIDEPEEEYADFDDFLRFWNGYLKQCLSPVRQADIGPMLVERDSRYLERDMTWEEWAQACPRSPFALPTEDEWEYLCNGGTRTLFRWGDSLKAEREEMFECGRVGADAAKLLTMPNMFGLHISYNSYKYELIDDPQYMKGGDGGSAVCGGSGLIYVAPCYSAFFRQTRKHTDRLHRNFHSCRRIVRL